MKMLIRSQNKFFLLIFISLLFVALLPIAFSKTTSFENKFVLNDTCSVSVNAQPENAPIDSLSAYDLMNLNSKGLSREVFEYAFSGMKHLIETGIISNDCVLTIVDLSKPSSSKRLFVIDLKNYKVLFNTYVAHGVNSGTAMANRFSNVVESNKTSLGFYKTQNTYLGGNGYSLHLKGLEKGFNDNAEKRAIVLHGADYVNENSIKQKGYIGRSFGCPSVPVKLHRPIIDRIKNGTCLFIYSNDKTYLSRSSIIAPINLANVHSGKLSLKS